MIDLRSLWPYDWERVKESVERTGRVLYVNEETEVTNFGEHLVRRTTHELFYHLAAPPKLLANPDVHIPHSRELLDLVVPQAADVVEAVRALQPARVGG